MKLYKTAYNMQGKVIGKLTVAEFVKSSKRGNWWRCVCECGNTLYEATAGDLNSGRITSCGCYRDSQEYADTKVEHGGRRTRKGKTTREYNIWCEMNRRCLDASRENFKWYGGRGITVCKEWQTSYAAFIASMGSCPEGLELDRINNQGNYEPSNCRWATHQDNCNNRG